MRLKSSLVQPLLALFVLSALTALPAAAQRDRYPKDRKATPASLYPKVSVLWDKVVTEQWPESLDLVNYSGELQQIQPGQCIRIAVIANGDGPGKLLETSRFSYSFDFHGERTSFHGESFAAMKRVKPEGGDFVTEALGAAGLQNPLPSMASIAALQASWCAPANVSDGDLNIDVVALTGQKETKLEHKTVPVLTFATARKSISFSNADSLGPWIQGYYKHPSPATLLPGIRVVASDDKLRGTLNTMQFMISALQSSKVAAEEMIAVLPNDTPATKIYGTYVLGQAGYPISALLEGFDEKTRNALIAKFPDAFDMAPDQMLFQKQDMLWAMFFATGRRQPVGAIASMLAWGKDYQVFEEARTAHQKDPSHKSELTPAIVRGVTFMSAGWSLSSLSRSEPLVIDYLQALQQSPQFPDAAKAELKDLYTNPAFKRQ